MSQSAFIDFTSSDVINNIKKAAKDHKTIVLTYRDSKGNVSGREGEPYEIKDGGVYMYCYLRQSIRFFKLDQIIDAKIGNKQFTPRFPIKID